MEVIYTRCAGLDVHKKTVVACRMRTLANGEKEQQTETFGTTTAQLLRLLDWLQEWGCTHVAMESTGEYWKPVYNLLEGQVEVLLVNARHVKALPGRKTDVKDAEWLAELLRHGLLRGSFIPPRPQRELRDLTRQRSNLVQERAAVVNRLQKVLEDANVKLACVVTDVMGVSARAILQALGQGQTDAAAMAALARGRLRSKQGELEQALQGRVREHHRFLLTQHLLHIDFLDEQIEHFHQAIAARIEPAPPMSSEAGPAVEESHGSPSTGVSPAVGPVPYAPARELLDTIPGIDRHLAEVIIAEIGTDMSRFPSARHLASWAGVAPGNNESAGKRRSGQITPGNPAVRKGLIQAAHGAARSKDTYLSALFHRLATRRGKKRAIVAVAHALVVIIYHVLLRREVYRELGGNYFDEQKRQSVTNRLVRRLEKLGYQVALEARPAVSVAAS